MLYVILGEEISGPLTKRRAVDADHRQRLAGLQNEGRLIVEGSCPAIDSLDPGPAGFSGGLAIAEFESLEAAQAWAEADPYVAAGIYGKVIVKPFIKEPRT